MLTESRQATLLSEITHEKNFFFFLHLAFNLHLIVAYLIFSSSYISSSHILSYAMMLSSSSEDRIFDELDDLLRFINEHAKSEDYAIVLKRIKKFKLDIKFKVWIICDRKRKSHECTKQNRCHDDNKHIKCFFSIIVKLVDENSDSWDFEVKNLQHNHAFIIVDAHSVLKRMTMTREIKNEIFRQMIVQITSREILFNLRLSYAANEKTNFDLINSDINFMIKSRDIYNIKAQLRRDDLDFMTSIQALMH